MLSLVLAAAALAPQESASAADAARLLDETWAAFGEPAALARLGTVRLQGRARSLNAEFEGPFTELLDLDGMSLLRTEFEDSDPTLFGCDGRVSWEAWSDQAVAKFDWHAAADFRRLFLHRHGDGLADDRGGWRGLWSGAAIGGEGTVDGKRCLRVVLTPRAAREHGLAEVAERRTPMPDVLWIDAASKLPVRYEQEMLRPLGGEVRLTESYADWKAFDGVRFPTLRVLEVPGAGLEFKVTAVEARVSSKPGDYALPETLQDTVRDSYPTAIRLPDPALQLAEQPLQHAVVLRATSPVAELSARRRAAFGEVERYLKSRGVPPTGALFTRYLARSGDGVTFEVGLPVAGPLAAGDNAPAGIATVVLPAGPAVQATHRGTYDRLIETHLRVERFVRRSGLVRTGPPLEIELTAPGREDGEVEVALVIPVAR